MKYVICDAIINSVVYICITVAAIHFEDPAILWWYILPLLF